MDSGTKIADIEQQLVELWSNYSVKPTRMAMSETVALHLISMGYDPAAFSADEDGVYYLEGDEKVRVTLK
jgi:hypothetical protein